MKLQKHWTELACFQQAFQSSESITLLPGGLLLPWSHPNAVHYCTAIPGQEASGLIKSCIGILTKTAFCRDTYIMWKKHFAWKTQVHTPAV